MTKKHRNTAIHILKELALSENEAILYTHMLRRPRCTVHELSTHAPFPRTMLYYVLNQLAQRGLVTSRKEKGRTVYLAENPERLYEVLHTQEQEFERSTRAVRELIPRLKRQYQLSSIRPNVRRFDGVLEYQKALDDVLLAKPTEVYAYERIGEKKSALEVHESHDKKRVTKKILKRVLFFESPSALKYIAQRRYDDMTQFRSIKEGAMNPFEADVILYDGRLLYTSYDDAHEPTALIVEDKALFTMQQSLFETLWKQGKDCTLAYTKKL